MDKKRILLIEDEPEFVMMVKMRLESNNYEMLCSYDGEDGLRKAYNEKPDLILLDIVVPGIDGYTICRRLKDDPAMRHIPIIVVSASGGRDLAERCEDAGADELLTKPFETKELLDMISKYLNNSKKNGGGPNV